MQMDGRVKRLIVALGLSMAGVEFAAAQSDGPAVFVANNGNCEGSVTSFTLNPDGTVNFVQKIVTGSVPCGSGQTHPGLNAQAISISPSGRWLVTGHGTISGSIEQLTFYEAHSDATLSILFTATTPDSPVDVGWIDDEYLAVTATPSGSDFIIIYKFDSEALTITQHYYQPVAYIFDFVIDRAHDLIFCRDGTFGVTVFRINSDRTITDLSVNPTPTGVYFLGPGLSPDGTKLYYGGGIAGDDHRVGGFHVDSASGTLTAMTGSPFTSSGDSPKQVVISQDNQYAFASHGGDADIHSFVIDQKSGTLTELSLPGAVYDVGGQGDSGNMIIMGDRLFVTRRYSNSLGPSGLLSLTIAKDGTLAQNGGTFSTTGSLPWDIAVWPGTAPACIADVTGDQLVNIDDLIAIINSWGSAGGPADVNSDGSVNEDDLIFVINAWGPCQ
jgi:6-phosphogluconolactonase (cycloisomerase 2 family)